jgi:hypothetical protein
LRNGEGIRFEEFANITESSNFEFNPIFLRFDIAKNFAIEGVFRDESRVVLGQIEALHPLHHVRNAPLRRVFGKWS